MQCRQFCCNFAIMKFIYWISKKLSLGKGTPASTVTGVIIAVAGVALSLMVMELSLAIASGFKNEIRRKVTGFDAAVSVLPARSFSENSADAVLTIDDRLLDIIKNATPPEADVYPALDRQAIIKTENDFAAVKCISHGPGHDDSFERSNIILGQWPTGFHTAAASDSIVISETISRSLGLSIGDKLYIYFFIDGHIKARRMYVAAIYSSNFAEYDKSVVYTSFNALQRLGGNENIAGKISIDGISVDNAHQVARNVENALINAAGSGELNVIYNVTDITYTGALYFNWLDLLDTNVVVIFALMLCVAAFTLISSLFIIILDRVGTIGILRSIGVSKRDVSKIFMLMALKTVGAGLIIGNIIGLGIIFLQHYTHLIPLDPEMYYLSYVPVDINLLHIMLINAGVIAGAWLILILPARLAAHIDPAITMRYQ